MEAIFGTSFHTLKKNPVTCFGCLNSKRCRVAGLSLETETVLSPVETDADSHRPLMSDEEEEVEVYVTQHQSIQQPNEPPAESSQAISFCQAFLLPGVLPVSPHKSLHH